MTTPTFEYQINDYLPERLEHYLSRFEELLAAGQSAAVNPTSSDRFFPGPGGMGPGRTDVPVLQGYMGSGTAESFHPEFEQDLRREIYSRFVTGDENPVQPNSYAGMNNRPSSGPESDAGGAMGELRLALDELIRAVEQNTERLGEQNRDTLELSD
jgi:hypothetical protein